MASQLNRRYNRSPQQLREAIAWAFQSRFPGVYFYETAPWHFVLKRGMHWPFTSYGEQIDLRVIASGEIEIRSRYQVPTQIFELGDNHANVELLARGIDDRCNAQAACCPACSALLAAATIRFCTACGGALHDLSVQRPVPNRTTGARITGCLIMLLLFVLLLLPLALMPIWLENQLIMD